MIELRWLIRKFETSEPVNPGRIGGRMRAGAKQERVLQYRVEEQELVEEMHEDGVRNVYVPKMSDWRDIPEIQEE